MSEEKFYAGQLNKTDDLNSVSSGGAFWALAQRVLETGGVVYGAVQENIDHIYHKRMDNLEDAKALRRSKYFQSFMGQCYEQAKKDLQDGREVLFSGTGCQIAGLTAFLGKQYDKLITCEVVCHGVPARKAWELFRREHEQTAGKQMTDLVFRDKSKGWSHNQYKITYEDGSVFKEESIKHLFHAGYLKGLFYRPCCGSCKFAAMPRTADITLADYWAYKETAFMQSKDLGVSLIIANTQKGDDLLLQSNAFLTLEQTSRESALNSCKHLSKHPSENKHRAGFMKALFQDGYHEAAKKYFKKGNKAAALSRRLKKLKMILKGDCHGK